MFLLVIYTTLASDNYSYFRKNLLTIDDKIIDDNLKYDINREAAKISTWSSGKIDKYRSLTGKAILPLD